MEGDGNWGRGGVSVTECQTFLFASCRAGKTVSAPNDVATVHGCPYRNHGRGNGP